MFKLPINGFLREVKADKNSLNPAERYASYVELVLPWSSLNLVDALSILSECVNKDFGIRRFLDFDSAVRSQVRKHRDEASTTENFLTIAQSLIDFTSDGPKIILPESKDVIETTSSLPSPTLTDLVLKEEELTRKPRNRAYGLSCQSTAFTLSAFDSESSRSSSLSTSVISAESLTISTASPMKSKKPIPMASSDSFLELVDIAPDFISTSDITEKDAGILSMQNSGATLFRPISPPMDRLEMKNTEGVIRHQFFERQMPYQRPLAKTSEKYKTWETMRNSYIYIYKKCIAMEHVQDALAEMTKYVYSPKKMSLSELYVKFPALIKRVDALKRKLHKKITNHFALRSENLIETPRPLSTL